MPDAFDRLAPHVLSVEGGYSDHPADRGGPTNHGITQATARRYGYAGDMRALTRDQALAIYRARYWSEPGFARLAVFAEPIAGELFDTGVNMGPATAVQLLQRALNVLAEGEPLKMDGDLGPITQARLRAYLAARRADGVEIVLKALNALQGERYIAIAERDPKQRAFLNGWLRARVWA